MKTRVIIAIVLTVISAGTIIAYHALKSTKKPATNPYSFSDRSSYNDFNDVSSYPSTYPSSTSPRSTDTASLPNKEEVNKNGQRRPVQYVHVCSSSNGILYVAQGEPKCLGNDTFTYDYDSSVPGTSLSSPCETTSGTKRYVYISNNQQCPAGTKLLFYNSLGGTDSTRL